MHRVPDPPPADAPAPIGDGRLDEWLEAVIREHFRPLYLS
jgi:hypothetical protein